ncbi:MAG: hypothetical protein RL605_314 [Actinomycetota bacterium]|jgi:CBS-domain-containing membrane protein
MSEQHIDGGHGDSIAAWTSVTIIMVAFAIGTAAVWFANAPLAYGSIALALVGVVAGPVLAKLGYGIHGKNQR